MNRKMKKCNFIITKCDSVKKQNYYVIKFLVLVFAIIATNFINANAQGINYAVYYDGYWSSWKSFSSYVNCYGNYNGFILYNTNYHMSEFFFKFEISNYITPSKKQIKEMRKNNRWFQYEGTVEYWVHEDYPTIKDVFKKFGGPVRKDDFENNWVTKKKPTVKRVAKAIIKIAPYKKRPKCYNIYFDDVGFGIDLGYYGWKK